MHTFELKTWKEAAGLFLVGIAAGAVASLLITYVVTPAEQTVGLA